MDENDILGGLIDIDCGGNQPQDVHCNFFYLVLGREIVSMNKSDEVFAVLQPLKGLEELRHLRKEEWPEFFAFKFPKVSPEETERAREERLNAYVRKPILTALARYSNSTLSITISRACNYFRMPAVINDSLTMLDIQIALHKQPQNPYDQHLDYFYLFVRSAVEAKDINVPQLLSELTGTWKLVIPEETWPHTFIGYFPKLPFESEREREWRLNTEVRLQLKHTLEDLIKQKLPNVTQEKIIVVLFTRACKYTC